MLIVSFRNMFGLYEIHRHIKDSREKVHKKVRFVFFIINTPPQKKRWLGTLGALTRTRSTLSWQLLSFLLRKMLTRLDFLQLARLSDHHRGVALDSQKPLLGWLCLFVCLVPFDMEGGKDVSGTLRTLAQS